LTDTAPALSAALDHEFADPRLLSQALTHRSYVNEHPDASDNDGLAFVGDAVLAWSWRASVDHAPGDKRRSPHATSR